MYKKNLKEIIDARIKSCMDNGGFRLDLSQIRLSSVPSEILKIPELEQLNLSKNHIDELPDFLFDLHNLKIISLQSNRIRVIPSGIERLINLIRIDLNDNELESIEEGLGNIGALTTVYLGRNNLRSLPSSLANLNNLKVLSLAGNRLNIPIEILNGDIGGLMNYLSAIEGEKYTLCEAKFLIVGEGDVGKTELCRSILGLQDGNPPDSTEGISILRWNVKPKDQEYIINLWDFGGQEIYHSTHQYFLTKKSVYVLVWTARTDDDFYSFDYWLNIINLLSDSSPLIIVQNKCDERIKEIDTSRITRQFKNISGFFNVSALNETGIDVLKKEIVKQVEKLDHFNQVVPIAWVKIREDLEGYQKPYMSYGEYLKVCSKYGLNKNKAEWLSEYFHVLGVFLHFDDNLILSDIVFLKPEWATAAAYIVFDEKEVINGNGLFSNRTLKRVWKGYPIDKYPALIELMKKFELCFEIEATGKYIVPARLPAVPPSVLFKPKEELSYRYEYQFMPAGIIERCIVRLHRLIFNNSYWKNGVLVKKGDTSALVESDRFKRSISIRLEGSSKAELLTIIRNEIDQIHQSLNYPQVTERIPCVCKECIGSEPYYYDMSVMERARSKGRKSIECRKSFESVEIRSILGGIDGTLESKENEILNLLNEIVDRFDTKESLAQKVNSSLHLKPSIFGVGVNLNYLIEKVLRDKI
ncbi:COR domain-containing protein [Neptunomonas japonica]|uniref:COR domain-containing protein n=1 Tax=Neptunomonas japonica TaxID=417574 RepID=UPI0004277352|nr:COR domain-containing protein [Neptunomonas japonica]